MWWRQWGAFPHPKSDRSPIGPSPKNLTKPASGGEAEVEERMRIKERYELALELRGYWAARREERGQMLDGYCLATGYNRKYAI